MKTATQRAKAAIDRITDDMLRGRISSVEAGDKIAIHKAVIEKHKPSNQKEGEMTPAKKVRLEREAIHAAKVAVADKSVNNINNYKEEDDMEEVDKTILWKRRAKCLNCTHFCRENPKLARVLGKVRGTAQKDAKGNPVMIEMPNDIVFDYRYWKLLGIPYKNGAYGKKGQLDYLAELLTDCRFHDFINESQLEEAKKSDANITNLDEQDAGEVDVFDGGDAIDDGKMDYRLWTCNHFNMTEDAKAYAKARRADMRDVKYAYFKQFLTELEEGNVTPAMMTVMATEQIPKFYNAKFEFIYHEAVEEITDMGVKMVYQAPDFNVEFLDRLDEVEYTGKEKYMPVKRLLHIMKTMDEATVVDFFKDAVGTKYSVGSSALWALTNKVQAKNNGELVVDEEGNAVMVDMITNHTYKEQAVAIVTEHNAKQWDPKTRVKSAKAVTKGEERAETWSVYFTAKRGAQISTSKLDGELVATGLTFDDACIVREDKARELIDIDNNTEFNMEDMFDGEMFVVDKYNN